MRVGIIVRELKIVVLEREYIVYIGIYVHLGQWSWLTGQLQLNLRKVVGIDMRVTQSVYKIADL